MPLFDYQAYDAAGLEKRGTVEAANPGEAQSRLRQQGLLPFALEESAHAAGTRAGDHSFSLGDQSRFARQLATLLRGGVPLAKALSGMETQDGWRHQRLGLMFIREEVERGRDLSQALGAAGNLFEPWALSVIRVGEVTGRLDGAFAELAQHLVRLMEHRRRLVAALAYPILMCVLAVGVLAFLMIYLIPSVQQIFADMQGKLPLITRILIWISDAVRRFWLPALGAGFLAAVFLRLGLAESGFRRRFEQFVAVLPLVGDFLANVRLKRWVRNLAMMVRCGVPLLEAVQLSRAGADSLLEQEALASLEQILVKGDSFSQALRKTEGYPALLVQMAEAGEASGRLPEMLADVAAEMEADSAGRVEVLLNLLEPLLIVTMGVVVGGIMIGVLLPIYEMNRLIR